jgi:holo-[acyl-carrier protein] synthase
VISGLGIDLIENCRFEGETARGEWTYESGIFTSGEIQYCCEGKQHAQRYAACFAAKEAVLKALGVEVRDLAVFREVEVKCDAGNVCGIVLHDRLHSEADRLGVRRINLSVAAAKKQTGVMVVLES